MCVISEFWDVLLFSKSMIIPPMEGVSLTNTLNKAFLASLLVFPPTLLAGYLMHLIQIAHIISPWIQFFYEDFTSPLYLPTLPYQGVARLRSLKIQHIKTETITEFTGPPSGKEESFPNDLYLPPPSEQHNNMPYLHRRKPPNTGSQTQSSSQSQELTIFQQIVPTAPESTMHNHSNKVHAYFTALGQSHPDYNKSE